MLLSSLYTVFSCANVIFALAERTAAKSNSLFFISVCFFVYIIRISVSFPLLSWVYYINRYKISNFLRNDQIFCRKKEEINKKSRISVDFTIYYKKIRLRATRSLIYLIVNYDVNILHPRSRQSSRSCQTF